MQFPAVKTSLVEASDKLNTNCRIFFKKESEQPSGSFKLRGIGYYIGHSIEKVQNEGKQVEVFTSSGGNAGLAAAYSSQFYGVNCTVVLPKLVKPSVVEKLKEYNATVHIHGEHWGEADLFLRNSIIEKLDHSQIESVYCHPFDEPLVWKGHGGMIEEIEQQMSTEDLSKVKGVICSVGGGGLFCGIVDGLRNSKSLQKVPVLAVETSGAPSFEEAIKQDKVVNLDSVKTLATSLAAPYVCQGALDAYRTHPVLNCVIDDIDSVRGTVFYYDTFGEVVEPACGATISIVSDNTKYLDKFKNLKPDDIVIAIVCGGVVTKESDIEESYRKMLND